MDNLIDMINMGQVMLETGFDSDAFLTWRHVSFVCLLGLLGPLNYYTRTFCSFTGEVAPQSLLVGEGILETARLAISQGQVPQKSSGMLKPLGDSCRFVPWLLRKKKWYSLERFKSQAQV
jgi:hypothetical protein